MAAKRLAVFDPSGRLLADLAPLADRAGVALQGVTAGEVRSVSCTAVLIAPMGAVDLGIASADGPPRWIVGDGTNAARLAGAAAQAGASGVMLTPLSVEGIAAVAHSEPVSPDFDLARARGLIATSLVDLTGSATETLLAVAEGFTAHDCIVWWRDGAQMLPTAARVHPSDTYRTQIAGAATEHGAFTSLTIPTKTVTPGSTNVTVSTGTAADTSGV